MNAQKSEVTREDAKTYLARNDLFQIFEEQKEPYLQKKFHVKLRKLSLLTGLLYRRPEKPLEYMEKCMQEAKQTKSLTWDSFLDVKLSENNDKPEPTISEAQLKSDVSGAYGVIFKTQPRDMKEAE